MSRIPDVTGGSHHHRLLVDGGRIEFGDQFSFGDDEHPVADAEHFG